MKRNTTRKIKNKPTLEFLRSYVLDGVPITYTLRYKSVKNFNLRVQNGHSFAISVPHGTPDSRIRRFLDEHADFLRKALYAQKEHACAWHRSLHDQPLEDGTEFRLLDQYVVLRIILNDDTKIKPNLKVEKDSDGSEIWWITASRCDSEQKSKQEIEKLIISEEIKYLKQAAADCLPDIGKKIMQAAEDLGISAEMKEEYPYIRFVTKPTTVRFRDMSSRWGSCTVQRGNICINSRLIFAPKSCFHYVVCHELCHFIYANHSASFYRLLQEAMPDAMENRKILQGKHHTK